MLGQNKISVTIGLACWSFLDGRKSRLSAVVSVFSRDGHDVGYRVDTAP